MILLLVWSVWYHFQGKFQGQFTKWQYFPMELSDYKYVILRTNRPRCALNANLLNDESFSGETSGRASL